MVKIKEWCKKHSSEIVVGVICTIITTVFFNMCTIVREVAPTAGNSVVRFFSNYYYITLSKTTEFSIFSALFSFVFGIGIGVIIIVVNKGFSVAKRAINGANRIITSLNNETEETVKSENKPKITREDIENEAKDILKQGKKMKRMTILFIVLCVIGIVDLFVFSVMPNIMWRAYQRDIVKIDPYVESRELEMIKSDWACMQTKEDYDNIYEYINEIKEENKLP